MAIALIIALLIAGGVTVGAENATPADFLYPVKVGITEKIRSAFTLGAQAEGELQASFAGRRLDELAEVTAEGGMNADIATELESRFETHADAVYNAIAELRAAGDFAGAAEVAAAFEGVLESRAVAVSQTNVEASAQASLTSDVKARIQSITDKAVVFKARANNLRVESENSVEASAEANIDVNVGSEAGTGTSGTEASGSGSVDGGLKLQY